MTVIKKRRINPPQRIKLITEKNKNKVSPAGKQKNAAAVTIAILLL